MGGGLFRLSGRFTMSTMAKNDPIPVDDQCPFFRQIVDSSPVLLHTARLNGYLEFFYQTWLDFAGMPLENLLGWGWAFLYSSLRCRSPCAEDARVLCQAKAVSGNIKSAKRQWCLAGVRNRLGEADDDDACADADQWWFWAELEHKPVQRTRILF